MSPTWNALAYEFWVYEYNESYSGNSEVSIDLLNRTVRAQQKILLPWLDVRGVDNRTSNEVVLCLSSMNGCSKELINDGTLTVFSTGIGGTFGAVSYWSICLNFFFSPINTVYHVVLSFIKDKEDLLIFEVWRKWQKWESPIYFLVFRHFLQNYFIQPVKLRNLNTRVKTYHITNFKY